jgi:hypothetical protein
MKSNSRTFLTGAVALAAAVALFAGCATATKTQFTEDLLQGSGFKIVRATTPADKAQLQTLRPGRLTVVHRDGKTWYVYPDATRQQLYVGTPEEYQAYRRACQDAQMVSEEGHAAPLHEDAVEWAYGGLDFEE